MAFDVREYREFVELLYKHPEWRAELRHLVLTEDILTLPQVVRELSVSVKELTEAQKRTDEQLMLLGQRVDALTEAQKRTDEQLMLLGQRVDALTEAQKHTEQRVEELADAQKRTEQRVEELAEAQKRTEQRVEELAEAQKRTEQRVDGLAYEVKEMRKEVGHLTTLLGSSLEDEAGSVAETVLEHKGYRVLQGASAVRLNGDVDVALPVEDPQGRRLWVLLECKARLGRADVHAWANRVRSTGYRQALREAGIEPPYLVYMYAIRIDFAAREAVQRAGLGLMKGEGEVYAPQGEMT